MTVTVKVLVPAKFAENSQTTQYTATGVGDCISTLAGTASAINLRISGREVT